MHVQYFEVDLLSVNDSTQSVFGFSIYQYPYGIHLCHRVKGLLVITFISLSISLGYQPSLVPFYCFIRP